MIRQVALDTETTGLDPKSGHRLTEIGCVELINRQVTGERFQVYLNPERELDERAAQITGLSYTFLKDKPKFAEKAADFLAFIDGAELIIHNAKFDLGFLNHELGRLGHSRLPLETHFSVLDTLVLARKTQPGHRYYNLDALCQRYKIENGHRTLHGALLDAEILAEVYLKMTAGQTSLGFGREAEEALLDDNKQFDPEAVLTTNLTLQGQKGPSTFPMTALRRTVIYATVEELAEHSGRLATIQQPLRNLKQ